MRKRARKSIGHAGKNPNAVALGRLGGLKGGPARAKKLTKEQLREQARQAVLTRWRKAKREGKQAGVQAQPNT